MNTDNRKLEPPDLGQFHQNRRNFPLQELARYAGQYVAWSPEGTRIVASGATEEEVEEKLAAAGIPASQVVGDYIEILESTQP